MLLEEEYLEDKTVKLKKLTGYQLLREVIALLLLCLAGFMLVALWTFHPNDPSWSYSAAANGVIHNGGGLLGAWSADILFSLFGMAAYLIPIALILHGWTVFRQHFTPPKTDYFTLSLKVIGLFALVISSCALAEINFNDWKTFTAGGIVGNLIAQGVTQSFNLAMAVVALILLWGIGFTLFTGISWLSIAEKIGACVTSIGAFIANRMRDSRERKQFTDQDEEDEDDNQEAPFVDDQLDLNFVTSTEQHKSPTADAKVTFKTQYPPIETEPKITPIDEKLALHEEREHKISVDAQADSEDKISRIIANIADRTPRSEVILPVGEVTQATPTHTDSNTQENHDALQTTSPVLNTPLTSEESHPNVAEHSQTEHEAQAPYAEHFALDRHLLVSANDPVNSGAKPTTTTEHPPVVTTTPVQPIAPEPVTLAPSVAYSHEKPTPTPVAEPPRVTEPQKVVEQNVTPHGGFMRESAQEMEESLIHPFLVHNDIPLKKPTTPMPTLDLLTPPPLTREAVDVDKLEDTARLIEARLSDYRVKADVVDISPGPVITLFELDLAPGVKAARISNLSRDLARSLSATAVRIVEVLPGRPYVGLELPNESRETVYLREVLDCDEFRNSKSPLSIVLGKDIAGQPVIANLAKMPHVLVAGTTGSGKSVGINAMILSMLYKSKPEDVRFIMIDPKMLELSVYEGIPHLLTEVVTDMKDAANALNWCVGEMERRYKLMSALGVRNLEGYNERVQQAIAMDNPVPDPLWKPNDSMDVSCPTLDKLPYIVVIVDEFADLMMAVGKKVEELTVRLAQKARAAGIHLVLATQRPSVDVITGLIKANIPTRIAFTVSSKIDSRTILDQGGAESLLGMGDMLYLGPNSNTPVRVHGAFVRDEEVHAVAQDWKARGKPQYIESITADEEEDGGYSMEDEELDPLFDQAVAFVIDKRKPSISGVQRQFRVGYNRAARIVEQMEAQGIVSPPGHNGQREVLAPENHL